MTQDTAQMPLDERGLEAAKKYAREECVLILDSGIAALIRAYLQTAAADVSGLVDVSDLVAKLRAGDQMNGRTVNCKLDACNCSVMDEAASTLQTLSASNAALEAENEKLRDYARKATATITGLTSGGSEFFAGRIGDMYIADLKFCEKRIREREQGLYEEIRRRAALSAPKGGQ